MEKTVCKTQGHNFVAIDVTPRKALDDEPTTPVFKKMCTKCGETQEL